MPSVDDLIACHLPPSLILSSSFPKSWESGTPNPLDKRLNISAFDKLLEFQAKTIFLTSSNVIPLLAARVSNLFSGELP